VNKPSTRGSKKGKAVKNEGEKPEFLKVGYYIREDQDTLIEKIRIAVREKTGEKRDKSELIREAIDDLAAKYGVK
jgi:hypothetical protein